jgi:hypothetical protein
VETDLESSRITCGENFLWKACNNILATKKNLFKKGIGLDSKCPICASEAETLEHLLWSCHSAMDAWTERNKKLHKCCYDFPSFFHVLQMIL